LDGLDATMRPSAEEVIGLHVSEERLDDRGSTSEKSFGLGIGKLVALAADGLVVLGATHDAPTLVGAAIVAARTGTPVRAMVDGLLAGSASGALRSLEGQNLTERTDEAVVFLVEDESRDVEFLGAGLWVDALWEVGDDVALGLGSGEVGGG